MQYRTQAPISFVSKCCTGLIAAQGSFSPEQVVVTTPAGNELAVHNVHLAAAPYGPYTAAKLLRAGELPTAVVAEVTREAAELREQEIAGWRAALEAQTTQGRHCILTGDFNEPSHLSSTGLSVGWPCSKAAEAAGLVDCYWTHCLRTGATPFDSWTWSWSRYLSQTSASEREFIDTHGEINDRIDYIYLASPPAASSLRSQAVDIRSCVLMCDNVSCAEVGNSPWPSDHAAVLATFVISSSASNGVASAGL